MAVWAIGDVQGCYDELCRLLERIDFDPDRDRLWLSGDLVNRGPGSLETLRLVRGLGESAVTVLGNHDLHLLAGVHGGHEERLNRTLKPVLAAPDRESLLAWLRHRPMLHRDPALGYTLVHAGLAPQWDIETAARCAGEVEARLRGPEYPAFFREMYGDEPDLWSPALVGRERERFIVNALTRTRFCTVDGRLDLSYKGPPGSQPAGYLPWFEVPGRRSRGQRIVFGHWSTLGPLEAPDVFPTDTGCLWGGCLTALRLEPPGDDGRPARVSEPCAGYYRPRRTFR
ncbi:MAG TPA: symmetrical bis(5'-nucleosyl)-tetraphosphatase [Gammaproteobacteria bacterium]|nr:symmetrical bis(5'-nucleosyl)-tetraphosphatase [Gammaproteobacteria bacterium]